VRPRSGRGRWAVAGRAGDVADAEEEVEEDEEGRLPCGGPLGAREGRAARGVAEEQRAGVEAAEQRAVDLEELPRLHQRVHRSEPRAHAPQHRRNVAQQRGERGERDRVGLAARAVQRGEQRVWCEREWHDKAASLQVHRARHQMERLLARAAAHLRQQRQVPGPNRSHSPRRPVSQRCGVEECVERPAHASSGTARAGA
jgi:hypothetical protein